MRIKQRPPTAPGRNTSASPTPFPGIPTSTCGSCPWSSFFPLFSGPRVPRLTTHSRSVLVSIFRCNTCPKVPFPLEPVPLDSMRGLLGYGTEVTFLPLNYSPSTQGPPDKHCNILINIHLAKLRNSPKSSYLFSCTPCGKPCPSVQAPRLQIKTSRARCRHSAAPVQAQTLQLETHLSVLNTCCSAYASVV